MTLANDSSNDAPSLADICAQCVAENGQNIFVKNVDEFEFWGDEENRQMSNDDVVLPVPVSEKLFDAFRRVRAATDSDDKDILEFFSSAQKTPLWNLNLDGSQITDAVLHDLLREHGENLLSLNITECYELTELINYLVRDISTRNLHTLNMGSMAKLFGPWLTTTTSTEESNDSVITVTEQDETSDKQMEQINSSENNDDIELEESSQNEEDIKQHLDVVDIIPVVHYDNSPSTSSSSTSTEKPPKPILTNICPNLIKFVLHGDQVEDILTNADVSFILLCFLKLTKVLFFCVLCFVLLYKIIFPNNFECFITWSQNSLFDTLIIPPKITEQNNTFLNFTKQNKKQPTNKQYINKTKCYTIKNVFLLEIFLECRQRTISKRFFSSFIATSTRFTRFGFVVLVEF